LPSWRTDWRTAIARDVLAFAVVHFVPPLRRYRRWYWIANGVAVVVGALIGVYAVLRDRLGTARPGEPDS
jgi:hypothetical protein